MRLSSWQPRSCRRYGLVLFVMAVLCAVWIVVEPPGKTSAAEHAAEMLQASGDQSSPGLGDSIEEAQQRSSGCITCHYPMDSPTMHTTGTVRLGCTDCHGGNAQIALPAGVAQDSPEYRDLTKQAHPRPRFAESARK